MIDKLVLTKKLVEQLELPSDQKSVNKWHKAWWQNPRSTNQNSLRLSDAGFLVFTEKLGITKYEISVPENTEWTAQLILRLDNFLESPYYIQKDKIIVFREKTAVELILYGGDIQKFGWAKAQSLKNNTEKST